MLNGAMRQTTAMNVSLTPEIRAFVADRIASGRFQNASEVVRAALRLLKADERKRHRSVPSAAETLHG